MKKLVVIAAAFMFFTGAAFAADLNFKMGLDFFGNMDNDMKQSQVMGGNQDWYSKTDTGFSVSAEYLYPVIDMLKLGGGLQYQFNRNEKNDSHPTDKFGFLPIYATVQFYPMKECGAYVKGNLGYNIIMKLDSRNKGDTKGGLYYGFGTGYDFKFGLIVEVMYDMYNGKAEWPNMEYDFKYSKLGVNVGYKFVI